MARGKRISDPSGDDKMVAGKLVDPSHDDAIVGRKKKHGKKSKKRGSKGKKRGLPAALKSHEFKKGRRATRKGTRRG
jgi:hypothetical protein